MRHRVFPSCSDIMGHVTNIWDVLPFCKKLILVDLRTSFKCIITVIICFIYISSDNISVDREYIIQDVKKGHLCICFYRGRTCFLKSCIFILYYVVRSYDSIVDFSRNPDCIKT